MQLTSVMVTGSFDGKIRFWQHHLQAKSINSQAFLTVEAHSSPVNAIQFSTDYQKMFSGSGSGTIKVWKQELSDAGINYTLIRAIETLKGSPIYSLTEHPEGRKLLVRTSQGVHSFDTRIGRIMSQYTISTTAESTKRDYLQVNINSIKVNIFLKAAYSACGEYVFAGTNDGKVAIWKSESGVFVNMYSNETFSTWQNSGPITDISFHPLDHSIAFTVWGAMEPIRVYTFDDKTPKLPSISEPTVVASRISQQK